jgi:inorganic phosphate transporter, PiT family
MRGQDGTSGVDWSKATEIGRSLLLSPLFGFIMAALLLLALKFVVRNPALYEAPQGKEPPPLWIRGILILTCTGVSFAHGSNDGQKGMGLIMLILIGTVPTAYALNRALPINQVQEFQVNSKAAAAVIQKKAEGYNVLGDPRPAGRVYVSQRKISEGTYPALAVLVNDISTQLAQYGSLAKVPAEAVGNARNDMYLVSEAIRLLMKDKENDLNKEGVATLNAYKRSLDSATKFIPLWVKIAVAIALGLRTMIGWKRIVITVGEKIGKDASHLRAGCGRRACRGRHDRCGRRPAPAGVDHPCALLRRRRHHGGERLGAAARDDTQLGGVGADAARRHHALGIPLLVLRAGVLRASRHVARRRAD